MPKFGKRSLENLKDVHPMLQHVLHKAIRYVDFTVIEGHRSPERQAELFLQGKTKARAGQSPHNSSPSTAVDIIPYPFTGWNDAAAFAHLAGFIRGLGEELGIKIRWGNDWDRDGRLVPRDPDESFSDQPHLELYLEE